jgi:hypothetical protein
MTRLSMNSALVDDDTHPALQSGIPSSKRVPSDFGF